MTDLHHTFAIPSTLKNGHTQRYQCGQAPSHVISYLLAQTLQTNPHQLLVYIADNNRQAENIAKSCEFFGTNQKHIFLMPDMEVLPYDLYAPAEHITSKRIKILNELQQIKQGIIIISIYALFDRLPPPHTINRNHAELSIGQNIDRDQLIQQLTNEGYKRANEVHQHGEFAIRGSMIDCFPSGLELPIRIDCFDNEIESLRHFDSETQRSTTHLDRVKLLPADVVTLNDKTIAQFRAQWRELFDNTSNCPMYEAISQGEKIAGLEHYLPLFFQQTQTLFDYLNQNSIIVFSEHFANLIREHQQLIYERYEQYRYDISRPLLPPNDLFINVDTIFSQLKQFNRIECIADQVTEDKAGKMNSDLKVIPFPPSEIDNPNPFNALYEFQNGCSGNVIIAAQSHGRTTVLLDQLKLILADVSVIDNWSNALLGNNTCYIIQAPLEHGFVSDRFSIITEDDIFTGHSRNTQSKHQATAFDPQHRIRALSELSEGSLVVHAKHGIARYLGLKNIASEHSETEFMLLEYANNDKIYVPITQLESISRYLTTNPDQALTKLGKGQWSNQKQKAIKQIRDIASELLTIYSQRQQQKGTSHALHENSYQNFSQAFAYTETDDQLKAIQNILVDLQKERPMDHLVCGDVGFGKTEVAMRAAFVVASTGKQVAILAPTTLLVNQHVENFTNRFSKWPIKIAALSRFNSPQKQKQILEELKNGKIDIIIGTHRLLSQDIQFEDLGLLIVDEEHRFGVTQKEKITKIKNNIDILALTATPIPRSLNMAFEGLRDISIIASPPENRLHIKTFYREYNMGIIHEAIMRETLRGGQTYFIHNDVATLQAQADLIQKQSPKLRIAVAHGQMPKKQLEEIMLDFYHQRIQCLVCTTIVESGLDVASANTIIINRADKLGLAQLHQLRGRVGRSHHQAYAYLLVPSKRAISTDSKRRLKTITEIDSLGAGFELANQDLEIRGAGELLGANQSGHIHTIGYTLYMELLKEAIDCFEKGETFDPVDNKNELDIDLGISCLFPDKYIGDVATRLQLYKRLSDLNDKSSMLDYKAEIIDRFGSLPPAAENLIQTRLLKLKAQNNNVQSIKCGTRYATICFKKDARINIDKLLNMIKTQPKIYRLKDNQTLQVTLSEDRTQRIFQIDETLQNLC